MHRTGLKHFLDDVQARFNVRLAAMLETHSLTSIETHTESPIEPLRDAQAETPAHAADFADWHLLAQVVAELAPALQARCIAISGSQGSGKSTFARILDDTLAVPSVVCSLDDFYLPQAARKTLAATEHPLLRTRGVPGTHDTAWLRRTLTHFHQGHGAALTVPRFDKGLDDRAEEISVAGQTLILEGWCLGITPLADEALQSPCNHLEAEWDEEGVWRGWVNEQIARHYQPLWHFVDFWIHLRVPGFDQVLQWRQQQEQELPALQRMSPTEIETFVAHYERWTRHMWAAPLPGPGLCIELDPAHAVDLFRCRSVAAS